MAYQRVFSNQLTHISLFAMTIQVKKSCGLWSAWKIHLTCKINGKLYLEIFGWVNLRAVFSCIEISWLGKHSTLHRVVHSYVQNITHSFMGTIAFRNVNHLRVVPYVFSLENIYKCEKVLGWNGGYHITKTKLIEWWSPCQEYIYWGQKCIPIGIALSYPTTS